MQLQEFLTLVSNIQNTPPDQAHSFLENIRRLYNELPDLQTTSFACFRMADQIMKLKGFNQSIHWMLEQCIYDIINKSIESEYKCGVDALRVISDTTAEYYKQSHLDPSLKFPLGCNRKLNWIEPEVGQEVDVVKPYITSTGFCAWTRGSLIAKQNKKYTVKYYNTDVPSTYKDLPLFDQLGSRTQDYQWRMSLNYGSHVDAFNRVWFAATVVEIGEENGSRRARITFRRFSEVGQKTDSEGNRYDGLGVNQDQWIDLLSYRIQKPGKMAKNLCYYSHSSEENLVDDTYDLLFEKEYSQQPFWVIMRCNYTRSLSYLHFFEHFCNKGGMDTFLRVLRNRDMLQQNILNLMIYIGNTSFLVPHMALKRYLPQILTEGLQYVKQTCKQFNIQKLDVASYFIDTLGKRLYSLSQKHYILNQLRKYLIIQFLKLNMEKQMIALKLLYELIRPLRPYQNEEQKVQLQNFMVQNQIFYKIIQNNVHEQILSRSVQLLRYMMETKIIGWREIDYIWNIIPPSDLRGRATIEKIIGDISKDFSFQYTAAIIDKLLQVKQTDLTIDKLNLLRILKDRELSTEFQLKILNFLWECLTVKATNIKQNIEQQVEKVFRGFVSTIKENAIRTGLLKSILERLRQITNPKNQMQLFKYFILTYPNKLEENQIINEGGYPQTVPEVVQFLKVSNIYETILRLLSLVKSKQKIEGILEFISFLFERDTDDVSLIVKVIYQQLGPSDIFLLWAKNLTSRALNFFIQLYENVSNLSKFQKLSFEGFKALKNILLDINQLEGNIKIIRKKKTPTVLIGPVMPPLANATNASTSTADYSEMKHQPEKQTIVTFVYVLKSPFQCKGLNFLLALLEIIKNNKVYDSIIKLIIHFIVHLDESILQRTQSNREQFLSRIIGQIGKISTANEYSDFIKLKLEIYVNLINELFAETEKDGLFDIQPHCSLIEGETIRLKVQNLITGNEINKKQLFPVEVNENCTFWGFKKKLAEIYNESPYSIDIIKFVNPIEDSQLGKSLFELHFFNQQNIKVQKKPPKQIPRYELTTEDNQNLSEKFGKIVQSWYDEFKNEAGLVGLQQLIQLSTVKWKGSIMREKDKLLDIINKYGLDVKGWLTLNEFKSFFLKKSIQNNSIVWRLLNLSGYKNNLKHKDEPEILLSINTYPRKILSTRIVYDTIFAILTNDLFQPVHFNFYKLLTLLETDLSLCKFIKVNIKQFFEGEKSIYRLSYGLESLLIELESNMELYGQFYELDGHVQIAKKLDTLIESKSIYALDTLVKTVVVPNMLRILNIYVYPLLSENIYIRFIKKIKLNHYDLEDIVKKISQFSQNQADGQLSMKEILFKKSKNIDIEFFYKLAFKIYNSLIINFKTQYLLKVNIQITRLYCSLAIVYKQFNPKCLLDGLKSQSMNIRRSCQNLIYLYLLEQKEKCKSFLDDLIEGIPLQAKFVSNNYFVIICLVIQKIIESTPEGQQNDDYFYRIAELLISLFLKTPNELRGSYPSNKILLGLLTAFSIILVKKPSVAKRLSHYKEILIKKCLFAYGVKERLAQIEIAPELLLSQNQPELFEDYTKCKSEQNRKHLMEAIFNLYKSDPERQLTFFEDFILPILNELPDGIRKTGPRYMHVGLNNLGSTCYMNSMLQVLNSIDTFRNALMMSQAENPLIQELKSLFSYLFFSQRVDYLPKNLLEAFVPPINPKIQQDTTEFLNFLFDQLEGALKDSPYKHLLEELFKGTQMAQMICHSCGAKREREEQFFTYSVEIQGKYDLHSALEGMHAGELISDCLCESCGNRSDTTKRNVLNQVPNIFFVHLKRIVFNYDVFINTKIHTRLFFPEELNFEPYTKEGLELRERLGVEYLKSLKDNQDQLKKFNDQLALHGKQKGSYNLKLKGIIVHSGTPDVGHYYAIIKKQNGWVKFDDSRVTTFPLSSFEQQCYGGACVVDEWGGFGSSKNAYVLVYEKQKKRDIIIQELTQQGTIVNKAVPYQDFKTFNSVKWYKNVWIDNHNLMLQQHITSDNYSKDFLNFIVKMLQITQSNATIQLISEIVFKISILSGEVGNLATIFNQNLHLITPQIFQKYILADPKRTFNFLFHNYNKLRQFAAIYIHQVLITCYRTGSVEVKGQVLKFIQEYLGSLHGQVAKNWLRIDGYFKLLEQIVVSSLEFPQLYSFIVNYDLIAYLIDFVLEKSSPINLVAKKYSLGTKSNPVNFNYALNTIFFLLKRSYGMVGQNYQQPVIPQSQLFYLSDNSIVCLSSMTFYEKLLKENQNIEVLSEIIQRLCIINLNFSHAISRVLLKAINQITDPQDQMVNATYCIYKILQIRDHLWEARAEALLGSANPYIFDKNVLTSLDEEKYVFTSSLEDLFPIECLLAYAHINRLRNPLAVLNILRTILQSCAVSDQAFNFLLKQPSPSYLYLRYIDWMRPYITHLVSFLNLNEKKKEEVSTRIRECITYMDQYDKRKWPMRVLIAGRIGEPQLIQKITSQSNQIEVNIYNVPVFAVQSLPLGNGNAAVDKFLTNCRLQTKVTADSNILNIFKQNSKPLAIKAKNVEEHEDKEIVSLFDQEPYPKKEEKQANKENAMQDVDHKQNVLKEDQKKKNIKGPQNEVQKQKQPIEEEVQLNLQDLREYPDYLRKIQVINKIESSKNAIIYIRKEVNHNSTLPNSIRLLVSHKSIETYWFNKADPFLQWGSIQYFLEVYDEKSKNHVDFFKTYGNFSQDNSIPEQTPGGQSEQNSEMEAEKQDPMVNRNMDLGGDLNEAEISCQGCTYFNPISNAECDICGTPLHNN